MEKLYSEFDHYDDYVIRSASSTDDGIDGAFISFASKIDIDLQTESGNARFEKLQKLLREDIVQPACESASEFVKYATAA